MKTTPAHQEQHLQQANMTNPGMLAGEVNPIVREKNNKLLMIALIVNGLTFISCILHWLFAWFICPIKIMDVCADASMITKTAYTWFQLVALIVILGAVVVNVAIDNKNGNAKLTSCLSLAHGAIMIYPLIGFWFLETGKALRTNEMTRTFQKIMFYVNHAFWAGSIVVPAFIGGLF
jgi:hypothetical protein